MFHGRFDEHDDYPDAFKSPTGLVLGLSLFETCLCNGVYDLRPFLIPTLCLLLGVVLLIIPRPQSCLVWSSFHRIIG